LVLVLALGVTVRRDAGDGPGFLLPEDPIRDALDRCLGRTTGEGSLADAERSLLALPPGKLARLLAADVEAVEDEARRLRALELLSRIATSEEVPYLALLAGGADGSAATTATEGAWRQALAEVLARDVRTFDDLAGHWVGTAEPLRAALLDAVVERGDPRGLGFLAWLAVNEPSTARDVAAGLLRLVPAAPLGGASTLQGAVVLLDSDDPLVLQSASIALSRARVEGAVPGWIALLEHRSPGVRDAAHRALEHLSGLALGTEPGRWARWYEAETAWLAESADEAYAELASPETERVLAAVREITSHRLARDERAGALAALLEHDDPSLRLAGCRALAGTGSTAVLADLVEVLEDDADEVRTAARAALFALTGLDLPGEAELWRAALET